MWSVNITSLLTDRKYPKVNFGMVVELLFYTFRLDVNQEANINDGGEEASGTMNNEVFDETHINSISILFFASFSGIKKTTSVLL